MPAKCTKDSPVDECPRSSLHDVAVIEPGNHLREQTDHHGRYALATGRSALICLIVLQLSKAAGAQSNGATILAWSFGFSPRAVHLSAGQPVALTFINRSGSRHDFTAPEFFAASRLISGAIKRGQVELAPNDSKTVVLVPRRGIYMAHCSHFMHKQLGMAAEIVVD